MSCRKFVSCFAVVLACLAGAALAPAQQSSGTAQLDVPYLPSTEAAVEAMLRLAEVKPTDVVYDLGCGDGRIVVGAAKLFGARGVGIDIDPDRIRDARANAAKAGVENLVRFEQADLFKADIGEATVVTLFLLTTINERLKPKLLAELKPGTRVVSNTFTMGDWQPDREGDVPAADGDAYFSRRVYMWTVPARAGK
jgi:SAM-dependent methyltransferase